MYHIECVYIYIYGQRPPPRPTFLNLRRGRCHINLENNIMHNNKTMEKPFSISDIKKTKKNKEKYGVSKYMIQENNLFPWFCVFFE